MLRSVHSPSDDQARRHIGVPSPIHVVSVPNRPWRAVLERFVPGTGPDPTREAKELGAHGIACRIVDPCPFPLDPLARRGTFYAGLDPLRALRVLLFERDADAVFCWYESSLLLIALLKPVLRFKPKLVMIDLPARGWRARNLVLDRVLPRLDGLMVLTRHSRAEAEAAYRLKRPPEVVGFCVDDRFFRPEPDQGTDDGYVLCVGDDAGRDWATLLAACATGGHDVRLRTSARLPPPLPGTVSVLPRTSFTGLRALYARARVVVVPLHPISSPSGITTVLEAMAMGKPVIVTDIGTTRDVVVHDRDALTVPPGDVGALARAMDRLMNDAELRRRLGRAARATVEREFTPTLHFARQARAIRDFVEDA